MTDLTKYKEPELPALPEKVMPAINELVSALAIPREMLASDEEIAYAWRDLPRELKLIPSELRGELIARMCVAVSTGLFDGAVNYAWNAAILHLRDKVRNFGLPVVAQILEKDFEGKHLLELQDSKLLDLCLKLNLLNEDGYFFLDQCRDVRNNFSAAHPTLGKINDREFVTFLNRCVKYALGESSSPKGVDIGAYISALKGPRFSKGQCDVWRDRLLDTHDAQRQLLISMAHGIYCDPGTPEPSRLNALDICNVLKEQFTTSLKSDLINKHSEYLAKGDEKRHTASLQFFEKLGILNLLNESEQHAVFSKAIDRLMSAHLGLNNFYNEPPFAERLYELSKNSNVPETVQEAYVEAVVTCYMGNGYGISWAAEPYYKKMIEAFSPREISLMVSLARKGGALYRRITSSSSCAKRYKEALYIIDPSSVPSGVKADYESFSK